MGWGVFSGPKTQKYPGYFCTTKGGCPYFLPNHKSINGTFVQKKCKNSQKMGKIWEKSSFFLKNFVVFSKNFPFFSLKFFQNFFKIFQFRQKNFKIFSRKFWKNIADFAIFLYKSTILGVGGLFLAQNTKVLSILLYNKGWGGPEGTQITKVCTNVPTCMYICTLAPPVRSMKHPIGKRMRNETRR